MNITRVFAVVVLLCYGCSNTSDSDYKKPERESLLIADSKVFDGMVSALNKSSLTTLKAMSKVYVTDDTIGVNEINYVRVLWNDSSGYVQADWLLLQGRVGVLIPPDDERIRVYTDKALKINSQITLGGFYLIAVERIDAISAAIKYGNGETPATGYVSLQNISVDTLNVAFCREYIAAQKKSDRGDSTTMKALRENERFASLMLHNQLFPHIDEPSTDIDEESEATFGETYNVDVPTGWFDEASQPISEEEWPAIIGAIAILDDGNERVVSLPNGLWNGRLGEEVSGPSVIKFRLTLSPAIKESFTFEVISSNNWSEPDGNITRTFANAEPGKKYEFTIEDGQLSANLACSHITIKVRVGDKIYTTQIICDCPGA